jgi:hypothetical protein
VFFFTFFGGNFADFYVKGKLLNKKGIISTAYVSGPYSRGSGKTRYKEYLYNFTVNDSIIYGSRTAGSISNTFISGDSAYVIYLPDNYDYADIFPKTIKPEDYLNQNLIKRYIKTGDGKWQIMGGAFLIGYLLIAVLLNFVSNYRDRR